MIAITKPQIKYLQSVCSGKFRSREERLEFISHFFGTEIKSVSELNMREADELLAYFTTGKVRDNKSFAFFDKHNSKHRAILSLCHQIGWIDEENTSVVNLNRLGGWIRSKRCPVQGKALKEMDNKELSKCIKALEGIFKSKYK